ncbi:MAG: N-acetyltransferase family protein [Alphaproteobacteria bacterium]
MLDARLFPVPTSRTQDLTDVEIRAATADDASAIVRMIRALAAYQDQDDTVSVTVEDILRDGFGPQPRFSAVIAERLGTAVGLAIFFETYSTWEGCPGMFIHDLFVAEEMRGKGVGQALVHHVAEVAARRGCSHVQLNVVHANRARDFYDRLGFSHVDDLLTYRLCGNAFRLMTAA